MDDWGRWDHYVEYTDRISGVRVRERCLGLRTAEAIAEIKRQLGFCRVQISHRKFSRHKETYPRVYDR